MTTSSAHAFAQLQRRRLLLAISLVTLTAAAVGAVPAPLAAASSPANNAVPLRVAHVDLDYVYDTDSAQQLRNLHALVKRIRALGVNTVFLQAFADPTGDGLARALYFPNRRLPMRSDLFKLAADQLHAHAGVAVYAWMPVLTFDLDPSLARILRWQADAPEHPPAPDPNAYRRLSPFDHEARRHIGEIYEDLARHAHFDGLLFHDDAIMGDMEDASAPALAAYAANGLPITPATKHDSPQHLSRWTRFKTKTLTDLTLELRDKVQAIKTAPIKTARNLFALPILEPSSEAWFAQNLDDFLGAYDWTAPMAMPFMEGVAASEATPWLERLVQAVARRPGALTRTVFELQARDWSREGGPAVGSHTLASWMRTLQGLGATSFGYYPDDFHRDRPQLDVVKPALTA